MEKFKKIIIFGFPHCGTTILKSIIGHIDSVEYIIEETQIINKSTEKEYIMCKWPFTEEDFFGNKYEDYIKIFIIRNPMYVFSSLNKRFSHKIISDHSLDRYIDTVKYFIHYKNNKKSNLYFIR